MKEFVGVTNRMFVLEVPSLKQEALIFHRIVIPYYSSLREKLEQSHFETPEQFQEIDWLIESGIVFEPDIRVLATGLDNSEFKHYRELEIEHLSQTSSLLSQDEEGNREIKNFDEFESHLRQHMEAHSRRISIQLREVMHIDAYPVVSKSLLHIQNPQADKSDVVQIVLNALPVPDEATPWEQIIEYRSDPDSAGKFLALRNWMSEMARAKLTSVEIEEKLEWLLYEYQKHLNLHRLKTNTGTFETVVIAAAEFLEDLANKRFSKIAKGLFKVKQRQIELIEGELTSPGREVAYIVKAREMFSS